MGGTGIIRCYFVRAGHGYDQLLVKLDAVHYQSNQLSVKKYGSLLPTLLLLCFEIKCRPPGVLPDHYSTLNDYCFTTQFFFLIDLRFVSRILIRSISRGVNGNSGFARTKVSLPFSSLPPLQIGK